MLSVWWQATSPVNIEPIPWLSPWAIVYLESIIRPDFEVIEHGSGGSTLWFAKHVKQVLSYETEQAWFQKIQMMKLKNVRIIYQENWRGFTKPNQKPFDLMLIDGMPLEARAGWLRSALHIVKQGGWVVLDNSNRSEYASARAEFAKYAKLVNSIDSNVTGTEYLITEFWQI